MRGHHRVGGRSYEEIRDDPQASWEEIIYTLRIEDKLRHPNLPIDKLIDLLETNHSQAFLVFENPSFPLWELTDPNSMAPLWGYIQDLMRDRIAMALEGGSGRHVSFFAANCALSILPIFESEYPNELTLRNLIVTTLRWCVQPTKALAKKATDDSRKTFFVYSSKKTRSKSMIAAVDAATSAADSVANVSFDQSRLWAAAAAQEASIAIDPDVGRTGYEWLRGAIQYASEVVSMSEKEVIAGAKQLLLNLGAEPLQSKRGS